MTPEEKARQEIDRQLIDAGWAVQDYKALNLSAGRGIALREVPLKTGPCDYLLLVDRRPVGVIEAKKAGTTLSGVADQSADYAKSLPDFLARLLPAGVATLPFLYEATGVEHMRLSLPSRVSASSFWTPRRRCESFVARFGFSRCNPLHSEYTGPTELPQKGLYWSKKAAICVFLF